MEGLKQLLNALEGMKPYRPQKTSNRFEALIERGWKYGLIAASVPFLALCGLAAWHYFSRLSATWVEIAVVCALTSQALAALTLLCPPVLMMCHIWFWKEKARAARDAELDHDHRLAGQLGRYASSDLQRAKLHLDLKTKRLERRLGHFIEGDGKKFAIFSLLMLNYTIGKMISEGGWQTLFSASFDSPVSTQVITWIMAFLFGISLGAVAVRIITARDAYRMELIDLALASRNVDK